MSIIDLLRVWWRPVIERYPHAPCEIGELVVSVACEEIGHGEEGGNNRGPNVERYGARPGSAWCAAFAGYCYEQAHRRAGQTLPFRRSAGAKRLTRNLAAVGVRRSRPLDARPGDLICWHRGRGVTWRGHVGIVERVADGLIYTIEGNVGPYPARVRRLIHDPSYERLYMVVGLC